MPVSLTKEGRIAVLTLEGSQPGHLLDLELAYSLESRCRAVGEDPDVLAVVLTASGDSFCAGEAPGEEPAGSAAFLGTPEGAGSVAVRAVAGLPVPSIAAVDGRAAGVGVELALACDLRLAAATATFQLTHLAEGGIPAAGGTQRLPRATGRSYALELLLLGEEVSAQEAWRMGLVSRVFDPSELLPEARSLAVRITEKAPIAVRYLREAVTKGMDVTLEQGLRLEGDLYFLLQTTADRMEGIRAFLERRPPQFRGE